MQDRYLFKAKRKDGREWVFGGLSYCETGAYFITNMGKDHISYIGFHQEVDPNTICQCTGLKDKNGKLIWENDIVVYYDMTEERYLISWEANKACYEYQQYGCSMMNFDELSGYKIEVLGNVFDNQELLEE